MCKRRRHSWGNYDHIAYPTNASGQRLTVDYTYDGDRHTDIASVNDNHGLTSTADYDDRFGLIKDRTNPNGQLTSYVYEVQGRLTGVTLPYEQGTGHKTTSYEYHPTDSSYPWAVAHHFDAFHPDDAIDTVAFVNGTGRQTETKQDATFFGGAGKPAAAGELPFMPRAKRALERARTEADRCRAGDLDVDHLLLGLLDPKGNMAVEVILVPGRRSRARPSARVRSPRGRRLNQPSGASSGTPW